MKKGVEIKKKLESLKKFFELYEKGRKPSVAELKSAANDLLLLDELLEE